MLHLEADSESTSLYVAVVTHSATPMPPDKLLLVMPRWPVDSLLGAPIEANISRDRKFSVPSLSKPQTVFCGACHQLIEMEVRSGEVLICIAFPFQSRRLV